METKVCMYLPGRVGHVNVWQRRCEGIKNQVCKAGGHGARVLVKRVNTAAGHNTTT